MEFSIKERQKLYSYFLKLFSVNKSEWKSLFQRNLMDCIIDCGKNENLLILDILTKLYQ